MGSRFLWRHSGGQFRRAPSLEELGFPVAKSGKECAQCGHRWNPLVVNGQCPKCGSAEGKMLEAYVSE